MRTRTHAHTHIWLPLYHFLAHLPSFIGMLSGCVCRMLRRLSVALSPSSHNGLSHPLAVRVNASRVDTVSLADETESAIESDERIDIENGIAG